MIFNANLDDKEYKDATIVFNPVTEFSFESLRRELTEFFTTYHQASAVIFIYCSKITNIEDLITLNIESILKSIPKVEEDFLQKNLYYVSYNESDFDVINGAFIKRNFKEIINQGLANIFVKNGGLIESNGISHHFVFPSGKHSAKFLRAANVLVNKPEIDFIALKTLHLFNKFEIETIYCDTLSISVIGYSMSNYLNKFGRKADVNIESFKSYSGLYDSNYIFDVGDIFLISASTSGGLINYLQEKHPEIKSNQICTLFYLSLGKESVAASERVVFNLLKKEKLAYGIEAYETFRPPNKPCVYCNNDSTAIQIVGDSFNLEAPTVKLRNIIAKKDITVNLKKFIKNFGLKRDIGTALKVSYSEMTIKRKKYSTYIDYELIIDNIQHYPDHKEKLDAYIKQFIPASTKYIIHLNDKGSQKLASYILQKIKKYSKHNISVINQSDLQENMIAESKSGAIIIVGSCITNGKNLLYLNRFFRNFEKIRLIYFIGINRTGCEQIHKDLKSNIKYGLYGPDNASFIEIETLYCDNFNSKTPWEAEVDYLKEVQNNLDISSEFINNRISTINSFAGIMSKGGTNEIFYSNFMNNDLQLRKNSAFFDGNNYFGKITQSDVYFTISCVLNNMRNSPRDGLYQTNFVKNILDPYIFNRFNDGIIQASILRCARPEELNYSFNVDHSDKMLMLLGTFIKYRKEYQGEAIYEFLFAIAIGKLRLWKSHYSVLLDALSNIDDERISIFSVGIKEVYDSII